jgi:hypothetical protein
VKPQHDTRRLTNGTPPPDYWKWTTATAVGIIVLLIAGWWNTVSKDQSATLKENNSVGNRVTALETEVRLMRVEFVALQLKIENMKK